MRQVTSTHISVRNDGAGIPIEMHRREQLYVPELVLGHLLTSSNFDDQVRKGTNGNIFLKKKKFLFFYFYSYWWT